MTNAQSKYTDSSVTKRGWTSSARWIDSTVDAFLDMMKDESIISSIVTLGFDGEFLSVYRPLLADRDDPDGDVESNHYIVGSSTNKIPSESLVKAPAKITGTFIVAIKKEDAGRHAEDATPLTSELVAGTAFEGMDDIILLLVPSVCPMPYGLEIIGHVEDPAIKRALRSYPEATIWYDCVLSAFSHKRDIKKILKRIDDDDMSTYLPGYREEDLNENGPFSIVTPVCLTTTDPATDLHQKLTDVAKKFAPNSQSNQPPANNQTPPSNNSQANSSITSQTLIDMAKALANPDHASKKKEDEMNLAILKNYFVCAHFDWDLGKRIGPLSQPILTPLVTQSFAYKGAARTANLKSGIESGMAPPHEKDLQARQNSMNQERRFSKISPASVNQLIKGMFEKQHIEDLTTDAANFDILTLANQSDPNAINLLTREEAAMNLEIDMGMADIHRSKPKTTSPRVGSLSSMKDVNVLMANATTFGSILTLPSGVPHHKVAYADIYNQLYWFAKTTRFAEWEEKYSSVQPQLYVIFFRVLDSIAVLLANFA